VFADIPVQVVFEWNSPRHTTDDAMPARRRAFTKAELQAFFAPGGGLQFYTNAASPISAQLIASSGKYINSAPPYGPEFVGTVNLINSVPGAPPVSTESVNIKVGAAYKQGKKTVYYGTLPKKCPKAGFPLKLELMFNSGESATTTYNAPCPKK